MVGRREVTLGGLAALASTRVQAQATNWPAKPIRLIVPYGPGGSADQVARLYAEKMSASLGQQIIVEDKPGASGGVGAQMVATAPPDGYTLLLSPTAIMAITPAARKVPYNPEDLVAVARLSTPILVVTLTNALGAKSWAEFVALAKANPGKYWFGSSGLGTITHLTGEVLTRAAGIQMQHSPYKTIVDATGDVFDGRIQMVFDPSFVPYAKAGKVFAAFVDQPARLPDLPNTPTTAEVGLDLKGFRARSWFGLFAPKGTPEPILKRLSDAAAQAAALAGHEGEVAARGAERGTSIQRRLRAAGARGPGLLRQAAEGPRYQAGIGAAPCETVPPHRRQTESDHGQAQDGKRQQQVEGSGQAQGRRQGEEACPAGRQESSAEEGCLAEESRLAEEGRRPARSSPRRSPSPVRACAARSRAARR